MARRLSTAPIWLLLAALVVVSTLVRFGAALSVTPGWIVPDEVVYSQLGQSLWSDGTLEILSRPTPFYSLFYPALAGLPLRLGSVDQGLVVLRALQALVMSATAIPVYLWGRSLMARGWALAAAALTLALPGLAYSGLAMTEVLFFPVVVLALWAAAAALARPTLRAQQLLLGALALALGTRLQAVVLLPVLLTALASTLLSERSRASLLRFAPTLVPLVLAGLGLCAWLLVTGGPASRILGAYAPAGEGGYSLAESGYWILHYAADLLLLTGVVPLCALVLVAVAARRGPSAPPAMRAFVAVALSAVLWFTIEVGVFGSRHVENRLAERDLIGLAPVLFLGLCLWLDRGAPRPRWATVAVVAAAAALLVRLPVAALINREGVWDSFTLTAVDRVHGWIGAGPRAVVLAVGAAALAALVLVPRRARWTLFAGLLALLAGTSIAAGGEIATASRSERVASVGVERSWIDRATEEPVSFVVSAEVSSDSVWRSLFWNRRLDYVFDLPGGAVIGPMPQIPLGVAADGALVSGDPTVAPPQVAVASEVLRFAGRKLAQEPGTKLALWRLELPARMLEWVQGLQFTAELGDVPLLRQQAHLVEYGCPGGELRLGLQSLSSATTTLDVQKDDGTHLRTIRLGAREAQTFTIPVEEPRPPRAPACAIDVVSDTEVLVPRIELVRE